MIFSYFNWNSMPKSAFFTIFWDHVRWPDDHIGWAHYINLSNLPKDQSLKVPQKKEIWQSSKTTFLFCFFGYRVFQTFLFFVEYRKSKKNVHLLWMVSIGPFQFVIIIDLSLNFLIQIITKLFVFIESSNYLWNLRITSVIIFIIGAVITRQLTNCKPDDKLSSSASAKEAFSVSVLHPFISCAKFMPTVIIFLAPPSHMFIYFSTRYG